ncbi:hypothetical protein [Rhodococcus pyridinivorans]|nr:hypothetical protein [Rhodococcus pyridinivorans]
MTRPELSALVVVCLSAATAGAVLAARAVILIAEAVDRRIESP